MSETNTRGGFNPTPQSDVEASRTHCNESPNSGAYVTDGGIATPAGRVDEVGEQLPVDESVIEQARIWAGRFRDANRVSRSPSVVAASALYLASRQAPPHCSQISCADAAGVSESPVYKCWPELVEVLNLEIERVGQHDRPVVVADPQGGLE